MTVLKIVDTLTHVQFKNHIRLNSQIFRPSLRAYSTNCDFCDHDLYTLTCIERPSTCAERCAIDMKCSHFTYIANLKGGTCHLKKAFGSGGAWASSVPSPSSYVCGYIHSRALIGIFLDVCAGMDVTGTIRSGTA
jgi:hypothetical protein